MIKSRITIMDVAQQAGVSKGAVSLALNNSPAISPETTARIRKIARELDYQPVRRRARGKRLNWCFLLPYTFRSYSYTDLDLSTIEVLEQYAQQYNASLQVSRLSEDGGLPESISTMDIDVFFIKSYCSDQLQKCSQLRNTRNIILYGFENNTDIGIQVLPNAVMGVQLLMDAALRSGCRELLILDVEKETVSSSLQREEVYYLSLLAAWRQVPCRLLAGQRESMPDELRAELAKGGGKTAVVGFRKSSFEQDVMKRIPCETLRLGRDYECFVTEYSPAAMQTPGFHYLDMRGPELIRQGILLSSGSIPVENCQLVLLPRLFRK